jgi:hypothetical protein
MSSTLTKRTLDSMRKSGYTCQVVEVWNPHAGVKNDLFGFIDVLCVKENEIIGIQVTSKSNMQARVEKILKHKNFIPVKKSGIKIVLHGWFLGEKKWELKIKTF